MGRVATTGQHIVGCPIGVLNARSVKRRPEPLQWDRGLFDCMVWRPWAAQSVKAACLWVPNIGCRACEGEGSVPRQQGRPMNHSEVCRQRPA